MVNVNIKFNGKDYLLSCDEGQEDSLKELASYLDTKYNELKNNLGNIGENKLLLITAIKIIDEFFDIKKKVDIKKKEFENLSEKFKEIKSLAIKYKEEKEVEIGKLNDKINEFKKMIEDSKSSYEHMLDKTTQSIQEIINNAEKEKNIQQMRYKKAYLRKKFILIRKKNYLKKKKFKFNLIFKLIRKHFLKKKILQLAIILQTMKLIF